MDNKAWAQEVAKKIKEKEIEVIKRSVNKVPYIAKNGVFDDLSETRLGWWTNGFWGGMMWQLYQATKEPVYKESAEELEKRISSVVTKSFTLLEARCFLRSVAAPLLRDFSDVFSLSTAPANSTKPSVVTIPLPNALPRFKNSVSSSTVELGSLCTVGSSTL